MSIRDLNLSQLDLEEIGTRNGITYINIECAFDIETTSVTLGNGEKVGFMYAWAFGIKDENHITYGRTWEEFQQLLNDLQAYFNLGRDRVLVCYVHNLGYEFQFMRKWFDWEDTFSVDNREPIMARTSTGIEFKDSYILSGYSLSKTANLLINHDIEKLDGDFDYDKVRHHRTKLTNPEMKYIRNDVLILLYYINEQIEAYGDITRVPITNTKRVRDFVHFNCYYTNDDHKKSSYGKYHRYKDLMDDLSLTPDVYKKSRRAFMGGYTHANPDYIGKTVKDVHSMDLISAYPSVMLTEMFPMSKGERIQFTPEYNYNHWRKEHNLLFDVRFKNIVRKQNVHEDYISESKSLVLEKPTINNGRVYSAEKLVTTITDVDFEIINQVYDWDKVEFANVIAFKKGFLPKSILESIITLYEDKTNLKGVKGKEQEYVLSKEMLNSVYGMTVTDIVKDKIDYNSVNDDWGLTNVNIDEEIKIYNEKRSRFLYYPWGIWVSAYARLKLWKAILVLGEDYVYSDTDSVKYTNPDKHEAFFEHHNQRQKKKLQLMCEIQNIDFDRVQPKDSNGERKIIGAFEHDGSYSMFKTLGAKIYIVEHADTKELEITVAGLNKVSGVEYLKKAFKANEEVFENFNSNLSVPAEHTGKINHLYNDEEHEFELIDYQGQKATVKTKSGIHMEKSSFTLSEVERITFLEELFSSQIISLGEKLA